MSLNVPDDECARVLRILAEPTRLQVIRTLLDGPKHVHRIHRGLGVEQSLLSHHLRVLRDAGLVEARRDGKAVLYRLSPALDPPRRRTALDLGCCRLTFD